MALGLCCKNRIEMSELHHISVSEIQGNSLSRRSPLIVAIER